MVPKRLSISLWIGQIVLAVIFLTSSYIKTSTPIDQLAIDLPWTAAFPGFVIRVLGVLEGLGAVGLVVPTLVRIAPGLTPISAAAVAALMACAGVFHLIRGEMSQVVGVIVLGTLAGGVAWGRFRDAPVTPLTDDDDDDDLNFDIPESGPSV